MEQRDRCAWHTPRSEERWGSTVPLLLCLWLRKKASVISITKKHSGTKSEATLLHWSKVSAKGKGTNWSSLTIPPHVHFHYFLSSSSFQWVLFVSVLSELLLKSRGFLYIDEHKWEGGHVCFPLHIGIQVSWFPELNEFFPKDLFKRLHKWGSCIIRLALFTNIVDICLPVSFKVRGSVHCNYLFEAFGSAPLLSWMPSSNPVYTWVFILAEVSLILDSLCSPPWIHTLA